LTALVIDASVLSPFARAARLGTLERLTTGSRRLVTGAVLAEIERGTDLFSGLADVLSLPWLEIVRSDSVAELVAFAAYTRRLGCTDDRNIGEASVLAYAEANGCAALLDDEVAVQLGRERGLDVRRSLGLIAGAVRDGALRPREAEALVGDLKAGGARYPCTAEEFIDWCHSADLL
jgi:predicted nucleic acid-binding protein